MQGLLLVDKPTGWTSFDVVNYVRRMIAQHEGVRPKSIKVGHIGTLDPMASGLLVLLIGKEYTVKAVDLAKLDKEYEVEFRLGVKSKSMDTETQLEHISDKKPTSGEVKAVIDSFRGSIKQTPPAYSALKINGKRAYQLAREGREVNIKPRNIEIYKIKMLSYKYPLVKMTAEVSSGTYIRSLVDDIGQQLKTGAVMTSLVRTKVGKYTLTASLKTKDLNPNNIESNLLNI